MHVGDEFVALKEMVGVLQPNGLLVCSMNNTLSPFSVPVRPKNHRKSSFIQNFRLPGTYRRYLRVLGVSLLRLQVTASSLRCRSPLEDFVFHRSAPFPLCARLTSGPYSGSPGWLTRFG